MFLFTFVLSAKSQVNLEWQRSYNYVNSDDIATDMAVDTVGNVYVTGRSSDGSYNDFATVKYNSTGQQLWVKRYSSVSSSSNDRARNIDLDTAGNVYVCGSGKNAKNNNTVIVIKYSPSGDMVWKQSFNTDSIETEDFEIDAVLSSDGNMYVTGYFYDSTSIVHPFLVKYNLDGKKLWSISDTSHIISVFGSNSITTDINGNVYVSANNQTYTTLLLKYNSEGILQWDVNVSGYLYDLVADTEGNIYGCGEKSFYAITIKCNSSGDSIWRKEFRTDSISGQAQAYSIRIDNENNIYITGWAGTDLSTGKDVLLIKYDTLGNEFWNRVYNSTNGGYDEGHELTFDLKNNIYIVGISNSNFCINLKYDPEGILKWVRTINTGVSVTGAGIYVDNSFNVISSATIFESGQNRNYLTIKYSQLTDIGFTSGIYPENYLLEQNYPNPFNPSTNLEFGIPELGYVSLKVYNASGKEVSTLVNEVKQPGNYSVKFNGANL
ncbi:MAG: SBBP repeat-containing protein, partial [Ignavibacteriae bacterium]|nr:SBBP repeat-containing protein [Ignavibacteriota bacterium]